MMSFLCFTFLKACTETIEIVHYISILSKSQQGLELVSNLRNMAKIEVRNVSDKLH